MAETKFTPGPWEVVAGRTVVSTSARKPIADLYEAKSGVVTADESRCNGLLIAAAPEMYEALAFALNVIDKVVAFRTTDADHNEKMGKARVALAKARGE